MKQKIFFIGLSIAIGLAACETSENNKQSNQNMNDVLDLSGMDTTVKPGDDFFSYANGNWIKNTEIPASQAAWGSFYVVRDKALENMKSILDEVSSNQQVKVGSVEQKVRDLYLSALDSTSIETAGILPLKANIDRIETLNNNTDVLNFILDEYTNGDGFLFSFGISPDEKNSNVQRPSFYQGGLGLPNNEYYLKNDEKSKDIRNSYKQYIAKLLNLGLGTSSQETEKIAEEIIAFETNLAKASKTPVERRDPEANYHLLSITEMNKIAPQFNWEKMLDKLGVKEKTIVVGQPDFYKEASKLLQTTPVEVWKNYLTFHTIRKYASWLSHSFADAHFEFYNKKLNGQQVPEERWKRASSLTNNLLGDALGELYVKKYFPPQAKKYMEDMVKNLQTAYAEKIEKADWLSDTTKKKALEKLESFMLKIGYPDAWKDYSSIFISKDNLFANMRAIGKWNYEYDLNKLGRPTDKSEWFMTAPTVNAYYNPSYNEIVFPAGILQPPFYFQNGDDAVNYGAIGFVIGHEMTHGFDDQGSQYDKEGNLNNWWTETDKKEYNKKAQQVIDLYNGFTVLDSIHVNGELTQGENIADIGGLAIAYAAFKMTEQGKSNQLIDGLTPDQRFFMSCAQVWRIKTRPERMEWRINNDPHSPEMFRVNGSVFNMDSFYKAFDVKPENKMYKIERDRIVIW